jgi:hypothetical protein
MRTYVLYSDKQSAWGSWVHGRMARDTGAERGAGAGERTRTDAATMERVFTGISAAVVRDHGGVASGGLRERSGRPPGAETE